MRACLILTAVLVVAATGCRRDLPSESTAPTDTAAQDAVGSARPTDTVPPRPQIPEPELPPPPLPEGTQVTYACDDGNVLDVTYTHATAVLRWPDGRVLQLSRGESPSRGGDVFVGGEVWLQRNGGSIRLRDGNAPVVPCKESSATA